jgi:hypothetical protein
MWLDSAQSWGLLKFELRMERRDETPMRKAVTALRTTRVAKAKRRNVVDEQPPAPKQLLIHDYLRGRIPRRRFANLVGEKTFRRVWEKLAASLQEIRPKTQPPSGRAPTEDDSTRLAIMGVANSFLLWNLPDGYGVGPLERVRTVDDTVWIFPIVLTSPGYGIVGEAGHIAVDRQKGRVVGCTPLETVQQRGRECYQRREEAVETAFLQARKS